MTKDQKTKIELESNNKMKNLNLILIIFIICSCGDKGSDDPAPSNIFCDDYYIDIINYDVVEPPPDMKVFVVIGQSNASGAAEALPEDLDIFDNIYLLLDDSNHWVKAQVSFNAFSNLVTAGAYDQLFRINFAYSFALELEAAYPDQSFGFMVNTRGSTTIKQWSKNNVCYECTMDKVLTIPYDIIGVLMHQGESDYDNPNWLYFASEMVFDFRFDIGYRVPFIFGEIARWNPNYLSFNQRIHSLSGLVDDIEIVSSEGLTGVDSAHFDRMSQLELGKRYFEAWRQ